MPHLLYGYGLGMISGAIRKRRQMPKFDDPTPTEIQKIIAGQIQETIQKSDQDFSRIIDFNEQEKISELKEKVMDLVMQEKFELAWFDNIAILNQVKREVALDWFKLGYEAVGR